MGGKWDSLVVEYRLAGAEARAQVTSMDAVGAAVAAVGRGAVVVVARLVLVEVQREWPRF